MIHKVVAAPLVHSMPRIRNTRINLFSFSNIVEKSTKVSLNSQTSRLRWSTMWIIDPPPSQGRIKYPLGSISALTNCAAAVALGPAPEPDKDLSQTCKTEQITLHEITSGIQCK